MTGIRFSTPADAAPIIADADSRLGDEDFADLYVNAWTETAFEFGLTRISPEDYDIVNSSCTGAEVDQDQALSAFSRLAHRHVDADGAQSMVDRILRDFARRLSFEV